MPRKLASHVSFLSDKAFGKARQRVLLKQTKLKSSSSEPDLTGENKIVDALNIRTKWLLTLEEMKFQNVNDN